MTRLMVIVVVAIFAAICHGSAVYYDAQDASNVDCSYAQTVMRMAEGGQVKLTDDDKKMIKVARVHCRKLSISSYEEDVLIRQMGPSETPSPPPTPSSSPSTGGGCGGGCDGGTGPPRGPLLPPGQACPCKCSDKAWAENECKNLQGICFVTKMMCPHGKFTCCGNRD